MRRPVVLVVLDGWGIREQRKGNAISLARTVNLDGYNARYPHSALSASGTDVGLIAGQMGNSHVGHLNIGAGRIVYQDIGRISYAIVTGSIKANPALQTAMSRLAPGGTLHLMGLLSDGGVHSHEDHVFGLVRLAQAAGVQTRLHLFLDGRDVPPRSALTYLSRLERVMAEGGNVRVATVMGRFHAMDRDQRWERVERAYAAMVAGAGIRAGSARTAIEQAYAHHETDEFITPTVVVGADGEPVGRIRSGDSIVFWNYRPDRARELSHAFVDADFAGFVRPEWPRVHYVTMTEYEAGLRADAIAFPPEAPPRNTIGEWVAQHGLTQLRIAETEKYAHVTYFFNGGIEAPNPGEERVLIPSPKVKTYDATPAMSAPEITTELVSRLAAGPPDFTVVNYANCDMVGHTGILPAAVEAVEAVDSALGRVVDAVTTLGGALLIISDHGNAEQMVDADGQPHTAHTTNPVPCILIDEMHLGAHLRDGILADVAPTLLELLELPVPPEMTGRSLIVHEGED